MDFVTFLSTPFLKKHLWWLLLFIKCLIQRLISQRQQVSALLLKTLLRVVHRIVCLQMDFFRFWLVAAMFVYIHTKCSSFTNRMLWRALLTHQMDKKESTFMGLFGFECPLRGEKKLLFEQGDLDSVLKSISTWIPAWILNLKMWILKMRAQAKLFEFLKSCISKCENRRRMNWVPPKKYNPLPLIEQLPGPEIKNILTSPQNPKFQLTL